MFRRVYRAWLGRNEVPVARLETRVELGHLSLRNVEYDVTAVREPDGVETLPGSRHLRIHADLKHVKVASHVSEGPNVIA